MTNRKFIKVTINNSSTEEYENDILIYNLQKIGFDGFEEHSYGIAAYICENKYLENMFKKTMGDNYSYRVEKIEDIDWIKYYSK